MLKLKKKNVTDFFSQTLLGSEWNLGVGKRKYSGIAHIQLLPWGILKAPC